MGVLLMLMTIGGVISAFILLIISIFTKKTWLRKFVFGGVLVWFVIYAIPLFATSIFSKDKTLALNEPKVFCGFYTDCHMHAAVTSVRTAKSLGNKRANGEFYIVKVKIFSDARQATLGNEEKKALAEAYQNLTGESVEKRAHLINRNL